MEFCLDDIARRILTQLLVREEFWGAIGECVWLRLELYRICP